MTKYHIIANRHNRPKRPKPIDCSLMVKKGYYHHYYLQVYIHLKYMILLIEKFLEMSQILSACKNRVMAANYI